MTWSYATLVEARCTRNPSLQPLHNFLSTPLPQTSTPARIISLDIFTNDDSETHPLPREVFPSRLVDELREDEKVRFPHDGDRTTTQVGQILFIENISREIISTLGANLSIDPAFFASHLHSAWREVEAQSPKFSELPSQTKRQDFATFSYHQSLIFPELDDQDYKLVPSASNIPRKVVVFPGKRGRRVGLAQHCCSILLVNTTRKGKGWLGLVLVDPPMGDTYVSLRSDQQATVIKTPSRPLFGRTEDFQTTTTDTKDTTLVKAQPSNHSSPNSGTAGQSMLNDLLDSWRTLPDDFAPHQLLTLRTLSYYPLRLVAAEWVSYLALMCFCLRQYDTPPSPAGSISHGKSEDAHATAAASTSRDLDRINSALVSISSWPRRVSSSTISLRKCASFIKHHAGGHDDAVSQWGSLLDDYEHLTRSLIQQGKQLETAVPLVTVYLQLAESRRANLETKDVSRLTILAFVFVPLSFVSGLFSMNPDISPGGSRFWLYFAVALPVVVLVLLVARPATWSRLYAWLKSIRDLSRGCSSCNRS